jgi:hypothetical protein
MESDYAIRTESINRSPWTSITAERTPTMVHIGAYQVSVKIKDVNNQTAVLTPATADDMPTDWSFDWPGFCHKTDFDCENIVKLVYEKQIWGLVRYGLYPYPGSPKFLEIEHLETNPTSRGQKTERLIEPVGKWLIWYAVQVGLRYCSEDVSERLIELVSLEEAFTYYRDIIQMQYLAPTTIAPGEDGYVFKFSRTEARAFCNRQEIDWGVPSSFDS